MVHFQQKSDSDENRRYMCYRLTLYNVQCQDNVNIVYNNNLLYKILINKSIIKITYVTISIPILPDIGWFNNTVVIQCTVYSVHWQLDTVWLCSVKPRVQVKLVLYDTPHTCMPPCFCGQASGCLLSCVLQHWDTCETPVRFSYTFGNTCSNIEYVVHACNNTLLH